LPDNPFFGIIKYIFYWTIKNIFIRYFISILFTFDILDKEKK
jgi:hypothetical protein